MEAIGPSNFKTVMQAFKELRELEAQLLLAAEWAELLYDETEGEVEGLNREERGLALLIAAREGQEKVRSLIMRGSACCFDTYTHLADNSGPSTHQFWTINTPPPAQRPSFLSSTLRKRSTGRYRVL